MTGRHEAALFQFLEEVVEKGADTIRVGKLRTLFGQERITVNVWRTIQDLWEELLQTSPVIANSQRKTELFVGTMDDGSFTFIWGEGIVYNKNMWFEPVSSKV